MHTISLNRNGSENVKYDSADSLLYIRRGQLSLFPNYAAVNHWHEDLEFIAILTGQMDFNINGNIVTLTPGNGILINSRQMHYGFSCERNECNFICILLHPLLLCSSKQIEREHILPVTANNDFQYLLLHQEVDWQKDVLDDLNRLLHAQEHDGSILKIQSLFFHLWSVVFDHLEPERKQKPHHSHQLTALKEMVAFIQNQYPEKITLDDICAAGKVCKSSCCALFKQYLNQSPNNYLIDYRIHKSIELLKDRDTRILDVGFAVGFSSSSYFAETFKARLGCSPKEYQAKLSVQA